MSMVMHARDNLLHAPRPLTLYRLSEAAYLIDADTPPHEAAKRCGWNSAASAARAAYRAGHAELARALRAGSTIGGAR